jgi:hypothetical protein
MTSEVVLKTIFTLEDWCINYFYIGSWKCISKFQSGINQENKIIQYFIYLKTTCLFKQLAK